MIEQHKKYQKIGKIVGFIVGYFSFTAILYFILLLSNNLSQGGDYWLVMGLVVLISLCGFGLKKILK